MAYVLDLSFRGYGTIGTYRAVTGHCGTSGYVRKHPGTVLAAWNSGGTVSVMGITQSAIDKSGETISVRCIGVSKAVWKASQGTAPVFGQYVRPFYDGKVGLRTKSDAGTLRAIPVVGLVVEAEGTGSANSEIKVLVNPQWV